jgi:hypothetical protein
MRWTAVYGAPAALTAKCVFLSLTTLLGRIYSEFWPEMCESMVAAKVV